MKDDQGSFKPAALQQSLILKQLVKTGEIKAGTFTKPSKVRMLDVSKPEDLSIYETAKNFKKKLCRCS
ncbi:MAG: hypothetical protein CM15mV60_050 [uncultured marine virus]|nr:MAG: hypothetical protein CM15mV60_050 [uncultured marine virus]